MNHALEELTRRHTCPRCAAAPGQPCISGFRHPDGIDPAEAPHLSRLQVTRARHPEELPAELDDEIRRAMNLAAGRRNSSRNPGGGS